MSEETKEIKQPSFGMVGFNRITYADMSENMTERGVALFGSSIMHNSCVTLTVRHAVLERRLHEDRIFAASGPDLLRIEMSETQFADMITSFGQGDGTPCTLVEINGKDIPYPTIENKRLQFDTEFEHQMKKVASAANGYYAEIERILAKPNVGKGDRDEIRKQIRLLKQEIASNIPFIKTQFTEQMDATVQEAKNEFDAHVEGKLRSLGLKGLEKALRADSASTFALESKPVEASHE